MSMTWEPLNDMDKTIIIVMFACIVFAIFGHLFGKRHN